MKKCTKAPAHSRAEIHIFLDFSCLQGFGMHEDLFNVPSLRPELKAWTDAGEHRHKEHLHQNTPIEWSTLMRKMGIPQIPPDAHSCCFHCPALHVMFCAPPMPCSTFQPARRKCASKRNTAQRMRRHLTDGTAFTMMRLPRQRPVHPFSNVFVRSPARE